MVLKSQIVEMRKLKAICLCAPHHSDRQYSQKIKSHFYYFEKLYLQEIDCWEVRKKNAIDLGILLEKVDVIFIVASMEFVKALEQNYSIKSRLRDVAIQGKTKVYSIKVAPFVTKIGFLGKLPSFPENSYLEDSKWEHLNAALAEVHDEVEHCLKTEQNRQDYIDKEWQYAQLWNTKEVYARFYKSFKHSEYAAKAKAKRDALAEAKLWNTVSTVKSMRAYFMYLQYSDYRPRIEEAAIRMTEIMGAEDLAKAEAKKFDDLFLHYHVKNRFPGKDTDDCLDTIDEYWKTTVANIDPSLASVTANNRSRRFERKQISKQLNANFLDYQASLMLNNDEQAVYFEFSKNIEELKRKLAIQKRRWLNELMNCNMFFVFFAILTIACAMYWQDYAILWSLLLVGGVATYLHISSSIRNFIVFTNYAQVYVRLNFPLIKSAILLHDEQLRMARGKHLPQIERDVTHIKYRKWTDVIGLSQMLDYTYLIPQTIVAA